MMFGNFQGLIKLLSGVLSFLQEILDRHCLELFPLQLDEMIRKNPRSYLKKRILRPGPLKYERFYTLFCSKV